MKNFLYLLIPVFALTVYGYCIFLFVSFVGADVAMDYNFFAILACAVLACVVNYRLFRREQTLSFVAAVNAALVVLIEIVGFSAANDIEGIILHAIAAIVFLSPVLFSLMLCRQPIRANTMLLFCEFSMMGTAFFMGFGLGNFEPPARATVLSIVCLTLNIFLLSSLRTDAPMQRKTEVKKQVEHGMILSAVVACSVFAAGAIVVFALPAARGALFAAAQAVSRFFVFLGAAIESIFVWLFAHLPAPPQVDTEFLPAESPSPIDEGQGLGELLEMSDTTKILLLVGAAAAVIVALLVVIIKMRKKKLRRFSRPVQATQEAIGRADGMAGRLRAWLRRFLRHLVFLRCLFAGRYTYEGFFVRLSRIARKKGYARGVSETPAAYLHRLIPVFAGADQPLPAAFVSDLTGQIDRRLYAPAAPQPALVDKSLARRLLRAASRIK